MTPMLLSSTPLSRRGLSFHPVGRFKDSFCSSIWESMPSFSDIQRMSIPLDEGLGERGRLGKGGYQKMRRRFTRPSKSFKEMIDTIPNKKP